MLVVSPSFRGKASFLSVLFSFFLFFSLFFFVRFLSNPISTRIDARSSSCALFFLSLPHHFAGLAIYSADIGTLRLHSPPDPDSDSVIFSTHPEDLFLFFSPLYLCFRLAHLSPSPSFLPSFFFFDRQIPRINSPGISRFGIHFSPKLCGTGKEGKMLANPGMYKCISKQ